jgi:hypothetical protein
MAPNDYDDEIDDEEEDDVESDEDNAPAAKKKRGKKWKVRAWIVAKNSSNDGAFLRGVKSHLHPSDGSSDCYLIVTGSQQAEASDELVLLVLSGQPPAHQGGEPHGLLR